MYAHVLPAENAHNQPSGVSYPSLKGVGLSLALPVEERLASETYGALTSALREIFPAAITSARPANPQDVQTNDA